jgi:hypothetical protein
VYQTYLITGKDSNLNGAYLTLERSAQQTCGKGYDDVASATRKGTGWSGPEVRRTYPSDSSIERLKPDSDGFRTVQYEVRLTYRDQQGRVTRVENFKVTDRLPPNFKELGCPPGAVCPK